jgi:hypothetical protein
MSLRRARSYSPRRHSGLLLAAALLAAALAGAGCQPAIEALPLDEITNQATGTPTPNPTILAVARMLTATAAAPTATIAPTATATRVVTATATTEVILEGSPKLPAPGDRPFALGSLALSVLASQQSEQVGRLKSQEGQTFLDLEILIENRGEQPVSYSPYYLRLDGPGELAYHPVVDALHPGLLSGTLWAGERVRGHVAFAIPQAGEEAPAGGFHLVFRPELADLPPGGALREAWIALPAGGVAGLPETGAADDPGGWPGGDLPGPGRRVEAGGVGLHVTEVAATDRVAFGRAGKDNRFVVLTVRIDNVTHPRLPYNPLYFRVKDQAGYEYLPTAGPPESSLQAGTLYPNQAVTGELIFEVPLADDRLVLSYLPTVLSEDYEEIRIELAVE